RDLAAARRAGRTRRRHLRGDRGPRKARGPGRAHPLAALRSPRGGRARDLGRLPYPPGRRARLWPRDPARSRAAVLLPEPPRTPRARARRGGRERVIGIIAGTPLGSSLAGRLRADGREVVVA